MAISCFAVKLYWFTEVLSYLFFQIIKKSKETLYNIVKAVNAAGNKTFLHLNLDASSGLCF